MQAYFARLNAEQKSPHEIVGLFVAESRQQLCDMVDECCDIDRVEVLEVGAGGLYWARDVDFVIPHPDPEDEDQPDLPPAATPSEFWMPAFFDENEDGWEALEWPALDAEIS